jgi:hypothetical protein
MKTIAAGLGGLIWIALRVQTMSLWFWAPIMVGAVVLTLVLMEEVDDEQR